ARAALECADREGMESLALPGMGTGVGRVPPAEAARVILDAVRCFRPRRLRKVILVGYEPEMLAAFRKAAGPGA
ncbi:MAG: macro domain-containing protein, partial [Acidobacteria bacterium]|nr:macro domain-containing protein [Acidobacteriota bacterium]